MARCCSVCHGLHTASLKNSSLYLQTLLLPLPLWAVVAYETSNSQA